ncbi:MAG: tetratricopeptide repeat protein [Betaproteobacteria bacterium]
MSDEMKRYLSVEIASELRAKGSQQGLIDALYHHGQLKLEYDAAMTRNAANAFHARTGNCLSLVLMTAAFAKQLGLPVRYQSVFTDETWSRIGDIYYLIGHVNLSIGKGPDDGGANNGDRDLVMIDFLPTRDVRGIRTRAIGEETVVAMFMNNRAAELLAEGQLDDAYWWAREAVRQEPRFLSAYNTLGAIYQRRGRPADAERVYAYVLEREPGNTRVLSNLVPVLTELGRVDEAQEMSRRLARLQPYPPFSYFNRGQAAMEAGDYRAARDLFAKELDRAAYYHEFHFWLAAALAKLGDNQHAREHLRMAMDTSTTRREHDLYAAKLERIEASGPAVVRDRIRPTMGIERVER